MPISLSKTCDYFRVIGLENSILVKSIILQKIIISRTNLINLIQDKLTTRTHKPSIQVFRESEIYTIFTFLSSKNKTCFFVALNDNIINFR
jgi:hypothetical protein